MSIEKRIHQTIESFVNASGYRLFRVKFLNSTILQIMVEPTDKSALSIDACAELSRSISAIIDVEDCIKQAYNLEISSPGLDRPLILPTDYADYKGFVIKVSLTPRLNAGDRRRFKGVLLDSTDHDITLKDGEETQQLFYTDIDEAKVVLTDDLMAHYLKKKDKHHEK